MQNELPESPPCRDNTTLPPEDALEHMDSDDLECSVCEVQLYEGEKEALECGCGEIHCAEHYAKCNNVTMRPDLGRGIFEVKSR